MDEWQKKRIDDEYERILAKLRGGSLYGSPVDEANVKALVVAAYYSGEKAELDRQAKRIPLWTGGRS